MTNPLHEAVEGENGQSPLQFRHRATIWMPEQTWGIAAARTKFLRRGKKLKQNRARATFKRNICDAKVTSVGMQLDRMERP